MQLDCKVTFYSDKVTTIEPALATLVGWQGENNAVLVNFIISGLDIAAGIQTKYRVDVVDGSGGVHNGVVMELDNTKAYTTLTVPYHLGRKITSAGGRAELTVVITTFENGLEVNTLITPPFTAMFGNSQSVGSFGEENNKREINDAVRQVEKLAEEFGEQTATLMEQVHDLFMETKEIYKAEELILSPSGKEDESHIFHIDHHYVELKANESYAFSIPHAIVGNGKMKLTFANGGSFNLKHDGNSYTGIYRPTEDVYPLTLYYLYVYGVEEFRGPVDLHIWHLLPMAKKLGDIEKALDNIIDIQNNLIGGEG